MKTKSQKRTNQKAIFPAIVKAVIAVALGAVISTASIMGTVGAFLPALAAFFAPALGLPALLGGAAALAWDGISVSDTAFLAASLICLPLRLMYNSKDKHKYPVAAAVVCGFMALSGNIAAAAAVGADIGTYASGALTAVLSGAAVFAFSRLSFGLVKGKAGVLERDRLILAALFGIAALSSWEYLYVNLGIVAYTVFSCCALYCLKRHEAAAFCAALSVGFVVSGEGIGLIGLVTAAVLARPASVNKNRRLAALYLLSAVMLLSLSLTETEWLHYTVSALVGTAVFCLMPERSLTFFIGKRKSQLLSGSQGAVSGKGTFLSAELEKLAARVSMGDNSSPALVEDAVYAGVCINCERNRECFGESGLSNKDKDKKHFCAHFDEVMSFASKAQKNIHLSAAEDSRAWERRRMFSCALTAASQAAREACGAQSVDAERVKAALEDAGVGCHEVYFAEDGSCEMYYPAEGRVGKRKVAAAFGGLSDNRLDFGERRESGGMIRLTYLPKRRFVASYSAFGLAKDEDGTTGDGVRFFEKGIYLYVLLSDGMGTGSRAGEYSSFLLESLEGLIQAGYTPETAISLASEGLMCSIKDEGFATLNMARLNLVNGEIDFYSCGEGTSFIFDGGGVKEIPGGGYPLGLMDEPSICRRTVSADGSGLLIMLTDGGSGIGASDISIVMNEWGIGVLSELAEAVCETAFSNQTAKTRDDVTVVAVNIEKI